jgi:hypothetical protein
MPKPHFSKAPPHVVTAADLHRQNVNLPTPSGPMPIRVDASLKVHLRDEVRGTLRHLRVESATIDKTTDTCDA